jgi:drug/metabolite transporter (DMT)-like permease
VTSGVESLTHARDIASRQRRGQLAVALAAVAWSSAGILQRELTLDVPSQLAGRAFFAMLALMAFTALAHRGDGLLAPYVTMGRAGVAVAVCAAASSGCFIWALNHTTVAHVLFIQAASPMIAALLAFLSLKEHISRRSAVAMVVAMAGVTAMIGDPRGGDWVGDGAALMMTFSFAVVIVITRHRRDVSMAPALTLAQFLLLVTFAPFAETARIDASDLWYLIALGAGQMGVGLALFTIGARLVPAAEAALIGLLEVVLGPLWVWIAFTERPDAATLVGGAIVLVAVVVQALAEPSGGRTAIAPPPAT